ncbi:group II intron reverse transcriptase/maturase [Pseudomonas sp. PIC25]|uniref:group II intron reverse transcriptase/maturase n=1 Tax=Pseudomonas sp. PIC25 TaxID=1958773 RepID=UPI000BAB46CA|nr:group II intron reverse transcriptase/maturase [Pseudomonas sp. PIC25]PAU54119.1 group II intron reverse transcriptase/maturase [Pseudomonas sp. PIC25]
MTTQAACAGALSGNSGGWHSIDWAGCHREVRRLQARIAKATLEGRWGKVKALQWLLTHSFSGKAMAVKRVTENQGKSTSGVDKIIWSTPKAKSQAVLSLSRRGYSPRPLRRMYIPKSNGKMRPLGIPTMTDRAMQALHLLALEPVAETTADPNSYGFWSQRCTADAIEHCFKALSRGNSPQWILEADIKGCFDNISHEWMLTNIPMDKVILHKWLKTGFMEDGQLFPTEAGTPQGGIISPTLANMTLDGIQAVLEKAFPWSTRRGQKVKVNLVRYADDFIITGVSKELLETEVKPLIESFLAERGLTLSAEKTKVTHIEDGFDFLGQNVRKYDGKLLIKPSRKNTSAFMQKVREIVKSNKQARQAQVIKQLNPVIRGWVNYHRHVVAKDAFQRVDYEIWRALWQWAKRRHPKKNRYWIKDRYFKHVGTRTWVFAAEQDDYAPNGKPKLVTLVYAGETPIRRYGKIKAAANPFDPSWEAYFEGRDDAKMKANLQGWRKLLRLWLSQGGQCPDCQRRITKETGWNVHRRVQRVHGGKDIVANLVMLHPQCHRQAHRQHVARPAHEHGL